MTNGEPTGKVRVSLTKDEPMPDKVRTSLQTFLSTLSVPQKVELASKGNKEVRQILSRDNNSMVTRAVIGSPRLGDSDILAYAASPQTSEDVLRAIGENREWMNNPRLVVLLASNPRTPPGVALRLLTRIPQRELAILARNTNVSVAVRREAKRLVATVRK